MTQINYTNIDYVVGIGMSLIDPVFFVGMDEYLPVLL
jgi:hypothetical protein